MIEERLGEDMCFIVGSPRSGTTVLAQLLGRHPEVAQLYEPYFLWEWHTGPGEDDRRVSSQADQRVKGFLRSEFDAYRRKAGASVLVEKTPVNSFRIPFIQAVFPNARWIHLLRDGRDATVSIHREWQRRRDVVASRNPARVLGLAASMLRRQPYWRNRLQALAYELRQRAVGPPAGWMNKAKWRDLPGWGPRFPGWYDALGAVDDVIEFNAMQWRRCVEYVEAELPDSGVLEVRYEDLASKPEATMETIQDFLRVDRLPGIGRELVTGSIGQWSSRLTADQQARVSRLLDDKLGDLGYTADQAPPAREPAR